MGHLLAQAEINPELMQPSGLEMALLGVGGLLGIIGLVLGIMVVVKMCQNGQQGLGIAAGVLMFCTGIGHLIALIFGWMKAKEWNIKNLMLGYTLCMIGSVVIGGAGYGIWISKIASELGKTGGGISIDGGDAGVSVDFPDGAAADPFSE